MLRITSSSSKAQAQPQPVEFLAVGTFSRQSESEPKILLGQLVIMGRSLQQTGVNKKLLSSCFLFGPYLPKRESLLFLSSCHSALPVAVTPALVASPRGSASLFSQHKQLLQWICVCESVPSEKRLHCCNMQFHSFTFPLSSIFMFFTATYTWLHYDTFQFQCASPAFC